MTRDASRRGVCTTEGCDRVSKTIIPGPCSGCYKRARNPNYAPRFPVTPLAEFAERRGIAIDDLPKSELTLERADALCIDVLGVHPFEVYGDFYFSAA